MVKSTSDRFTRKFGELILADADQGLSERQLQLQYKLQKAVNIHLNSYLSSHTAPPALRGSHLLIVLFTCYQLEKPGPPCSRERFPWRFRQLNDSRSSSYTLFVALRLP